MAFKTTRYQQFGPATHLRAPKPADKRKLQKNQAQQNHYLLRQTIRSGVKSAAGPDVT
jgi:hypothetical protein